MKTLSILFAGEAAVASYIDGTSDSRIFIRALPQRWLGRVIECCEFKHALVELCAYHKAEDAAEKFDGDPAYPDITPPAGYAAVPQGWTDNLTDECVDRLYELAQKLNFQRAATWAEGQIAAKKLVAPLHEKAINQVLPVLESVMKPLLKKLDSLSSSTPSAPSSSDAPAKSS
jgi:hypothetical protein